MTDSNQSTSGRRHTLADVARLAGVSTATVSNTLTDAIFVEPATKARVLEAVKRLGYVPNLRARRLRTGGADTIALLVGSPVSISGGRARLGFTMEIAAVAAQIAMENRMALTLAPYGTKADHLGHLHFDGALVIDPLDDDPAIALVRSRGVPVVSIGRYSVDVSIPYVDMLQFEAAETLLNHLVERDCRKIALVVPEQPRHSNREAVRSYLSLMGGLGREPIMRTVDATGGEAAAFDVVLELLKDRPDVDGLFVSVDALAVGACRAAQALDRSIPQQLKVVTRYDGNLARENDPPLTSLNLRLAEAAALAVRMLVKIMVGEAVHDHPQIEPAILVPRRSSMNDHPA